MFIYNNYNYRNTTLNSNYAKPNAEATTSNTNKRIPDFEDRELKRLGTTADGQPIYDLEVYDPKKHLSPKELGEIYRKQYNEAHNLNGQSIDRGVVDKLADEYVRGWLENGTQSGSGGIGEYDANGNKVKRSWNESMATLIANQRYAFPATEKMFNEFLTENGIEIGENEEIKMFVDGKLKVTVSGLEDKEKAKKIEDLLNNPDERWGRQLNVLIRKYSAEYRSIDRETARLMSQKNSTEDNLRYNSGGTLSLSDLWLEDGKIMGLSPELDELYNVTKKDLSEGDKIGWEATNKMIKKLLTIGLDNISDITAEVTFKGGNLSINDYVDPFVA